MKKIDEWWAEHRPPETTTLTEEGREVTASMLELTGRFWIFYGGSERREAPDPDNPHAPYNPLASIAPLLDPLAALNLIAERHGNPEQLAQAARGLCRSGRTALHRPLMRPSSRLPARSELAFTVGYLRFIRRRALAAERILAMEGFRYDWRGRRLVTARGRRGRPRDLLHDAVGLLWEALQPWHEEKSGRDQWNSEEVRELLRLKLLHYFAPTQLSTRAGGPIDNALNAYLQTRERR